MDRFTRLLAGADRATRILEIGPSHAPVAARADGWNTRIVDHDTADGLRAKYRAIGVETARIEEVDYIWHGGPLDGIVPQGSFDLLIASHVVEHIPDLAGFLKGLESVMAPTGQVSFAVPDKRYCFDVFKPLATTGDLLAALGTSLHSKRSAWNHPAYSVTYDGVIAWGQHPVNEARFIHDFGDAQKSLAAWTEDGPYQDYHAWQFTPSSFALIILELGAAGYIDWHIAELTGAEGCEFFVLLRRGAEQLAPPELAACRMTLLRQAQREIADGLTFQGLAPAASTAPITGRGSADTRLAALENAMALQNARLLLLLQTPAWVRGLAAILRRVAALLRR